MTSEEIALDFLSKYPNEANEHLVASYTKVNGMIDNLNMLTDMIVV